MKTSKMLLVGILIVALAAIAAPSFAAGNAGASASATLVTAIAIEKTTDLDFGRIVADGVGGTAIIAADAAGARTGTALLVPAVDGTSAVFHVTGTGTNTFAITLTQPTDDKIITGDGADATKTLGVVLVRDASTGTLVAGAKDIYVGGTLTVGATNIAGLYTGTFDVAVVYN